jgi:poly-gamma-glutamate synthesis protein (capsule biosynthesis protein)
VNDRGKAGLERTISVINDRKLKYAGSYINKTQRDSIYPLIMEQKGVRIALLNYTYGTNANTARSPNIVNMIDTVQIKKDIKKAEALNADLTVMTIHWGTEYEPKGNVEQQKLSQLFVCEGIDLIIGGHPHVVQNAELITKNSSVVPVFYSLGNSVSNQRKPHTDGGIMVKVKIGVQSKKIISSSYLPVYVHRGVLNDKFQYYLIPTIDFIKSPSTFSIPSNDSLSLVYFDGQTRLSLQNVSVLDEVFEY